MDQPAEWQQSDLRTEADAEEMAKYIRRSKHFVVFTGAGISTAAGLPTSRGNYGIQTLRKSGDARKVAVAAQVEARLDTYDAYPTKAHMALAQLVEKGIVKHVITQNYDGLHRMSGIPEDKISYIHGDQYVEKCEICGDEYIRNFRVASAIVADHEPVEGEARRLDDRHTSRLCRVCHEHLVDTLVRFEDNLPEKACRRAVSHIKRADLCLVLGSSLRMDPGVSELIGRVASKKGAHLVICNLECTNYHKYVSRVEGYCTTDDFMGHLMNQLKLPIPAYKIRRRVRTAFATDNRTKKQTLRVWGVELDDGNMPDGRSLAWVDAKLPGHGRIHGLANHPGPMLLKMPSVLALNTVVTLTLQPQPPELESVVVDITYLGDGPQSNTDQVLTLSPPPPPPKDEGPRDWIVKLLKEAGVQKTVATGV